MVCQVWINGVPEKVYTTKVSNSWNQKAQEMPFFIAETEDTAQVEICVDIPVSSVCIRPKSAGINCTWEGNRVKFSAPAGAKLSVEINGKIETAIAAFISRPVAKPEKVTHFFPEGVHEIGILKLGDGDVLYMEKGAYLKGKLNLKGSGIRVCGNGILSGEVFDKSSPAECNFLVLTTCSDSKISDVTLLQSLQWNMRITGCERLEIADVKIIGYRGNNDGVDVCGSREVEVHDCFIRSTDDCLCVKGFNTGDVRNVYFHDCILWNDYANPIRVGGIRADKAENLYFQRIQIIHNRAGYPCFALLEGNRARIDGILVDDLVAEDTRNAHLFDVRMQRNLWNTDPVVGGAKHICFRNIRMEGTWPFLRMPQDSILKGWSAESEIDGVTFENIWVRGKQMTSLEDCRIDVREHVKNVTFLFDGEKSETVKTKIRVKEILRGEDGYARVKFSISAEFSGKRAGKISLWPVIYPMLVQEDGEFAPSEVFLDKNGRGEKEYEVRMRPGKHLITVESEDAYVLPARELVEIPLWIPEISAGVELPVYPMKRMGGQELVRCSLGRTDEGLLCRMVLRSEEIVGKGERFALYFVEKTARKEGDALFNCAETTDGLAPAMMYRSTGAVTEPIMRNYEEIQWTLNNAPEYRRMVCFTGWPQVKMKKESFVKEMQQESGGNHFTAVKRTEEDMAGAKISCRKDGEWALVEIELPYDAIGLDREKAWEMEVTFTPAEGRSEDLYSCALFSSMKPEISVHMFAEIR